MARSVLEVRELWAEDGRGGALGGVSLEAAAGQIVAVVGSDDADRALLVGCLSLEVAAREGSILLHGVDVAGAGEKRRRQLRSRAIGLVASRPEATPGPGMRQRIQLARAITTEHDLLLVEEPGVGVEPAGRARILDLIVQLRKETKTAVVITTGDVDVAGYLADRVVVLDGGEVVDTGSSAQVLGGLRLGRRSA